MQTGPRLAIGVLSMVAALGCAKWTRAQEASQDVDLRPATRVLPDPPRVAKAQPFANSAESRRDDSFEKRENIFQLETRFSKESSLRDSAEFAKGCAF